MTRLQLFGPLDGVAVGLILTSWLVIGWVIENPPDTHPSVSKLMTRYRREWMVELITRQPRIFDAAVLDTLRQGTSFFASACLIAIGGALAAIGNAERLAGVAEDLTFDAPVIIWEVKILLALVFVTNAMLKFIWSHRLFGYCAVLMASVPNDIESPKGLPRAAKAASINISAARAFNRGIRAMYFALGSLTWLMGPQALMAGTVLTLLVLGRREFASDSRRTLLESEE